MSPQTLGESPTGHLQSQTDRGNRRLGVALAVGILLVGGVFTGLEWRNAGRALRRTMMTQAMMLAASLDETRIASLTGSTNDLTSPDYRNIREKLIRIRATNPKYRYLYLMGRREAQSPFFYMGTAPEDSPDYSPPGQVYFEDSPTLNQVFASRAAAISPPFRDRWGTWVSALVPLERRQPDGSLVVFGMDYDVSDWRYDVAQRALTPAVITCLTLILLVASAQHLRRRELASHVALLKNNEAVLRESEAFRKRVFDSSHVPIVVMDPVTSRFMDCNPAATEIYRFASREETLGKTPADVSAPNQYDGTPSAERAQAYIAQALKEGSVVFEWRHRRPGGETWDAKVHLLRFDSNGRPLLQFTLEDATEHKRTETVLNESERRFRELFERSPDAVFVEDQCGMILDANPAACRLHGLTRDELVGKNVLDTVPPEAKETVSREFTKWLTGELTQAEGVSLTADGQHVPVEIRGAVIQYGEQPALLLHVRDISERKIAENRIRQQAALLEASHDAILVWDIARGIQFMNPAAEELTGKTATQAQAQELSVVLRPRSDLALRAAIQEVTTHGHWSGELGLLTGDDKPRTVASRWTVLADDQGKPTSILITCNDITEKKHLQDQYLRAQRLESVGTLASGVAHDLNNILSPIIMGVEMLNLNPVDEDTRSILVMMQESAHRGRDTVKQLLTFARGTESQKGPVQPRHLLEEVARLLQQTFPKNIQIYTDCAAQPATVLGDPSQLHQVLMNLCVNARDAMPEGGVLFLTLQNRTLDEVTSSMHPKARPIPYVVFKVSDSGSGIPPEVMDRIFDPFFTTKPQGKGTGLGLATVLGIVETHGGFLMVESKPGNGTAFQVFLPASIPHDTDCAQAETPTIPHAHGELVLIVDDEPAVLRMAEGVLRRGGYTTLTAMSASEGLSLYEKHHERIRAVLTDIMMPFGDGRQLIAMLYEHDPKLPIVAMSGHATSEFQRETLTRGAKAFVPKPFSADQLLGVLDKVVRANLD